MKKMNVLSVKFIHLESVTTYRLSKTTFWVVITTNERIEHDPATLSKTTFWVVITTCCRSASRYVGLSKTTFWVVITTRRGFLWEADTLSKTTFWVVITTVAKAARAALLLSKTTFWVVITTIHLWIFLQVGCRRPHFEWLLQRSSFLKEWFHFCGSILSFYMFG